MGKLAVFCLLHFYVFFSSSDPIYLNTQIHDVRGSELYVTLSDFKEVIITYSGKNANFKPNDYITSVDEKSVLSESLQDFFLYAEQEKVAPIIDDNDEKMNGFRLLGFVLIKPLKFKELSLRRGDIKFEVKSNGEIDESKIPPTEYQMNGGGRCITSKDCNLFHGSCNNNQCKCNQTFTGSYCQINKNMQDKHLAALSKDSIKLTTTTTTTTSTTAQSPESPTDSSDKIKTSENSNINNNNNGETVTQSSGRKSGPKGKPGARGGRAGGGRARGGGQPNTGNSTTTSPGISDASKETGTTGGAATTISSTSTSASSSSSSNINSNTVTVDPKKEENVTSPYPVPYDAGRVPRELNQLRQQNRVNRKSFIYSVRFRSGPIGISFDNKLPDATMVESVVRGSLAEESDIRPGDFLIAVDSYNTTDYPPKITQRLLQGLPWPRVLIFEMRGMGTEKEIKQKEVEILRKRMLNISIIYPPTVSGMFQILQSSWTPPLLSQTQDQCILYTVKAATDTFGCSQEPGQFLTAPHLLSISSNKGQVDLSTQEESPMSVLLAQEAAKAGVQLEIQTLAVLKRGVCTFVEKAKSLTTGAAGFGLVVNTENDVMEMPAGRENTSSCTVPMAIISESNGSLLHVVSRNSEVFAVLSDSALGSNFSPSCNKLLTLASSIVDRWAHSIPMLSVNHILNTPIPTKKRSKVEEGGRLALSGENGWSFFDYHLALFGPQEVPLGPHRLQMAMPPFGCDPAAYEVRVTGMIVAILRGGGCSFGIKVINAQKLGAKAVIIVNTDDKSTLRLMALPDEEPHIHISCIMVGRRVQHYLEQMLKYYYLIDQHIVSIQPTGIFGDYDNRNAAKLPEKMGI